LKGSHRLFLALLGLVGFVVLWIIFRAYYTRFDLLLCTEQWGQFGDYVGGIANPIFGFLTFIGILWTISITYDQRNDQKLEDKKNDIFKVIEIIHAECILILKINKDCIAFDAFESPKELAYYLDKFPVIIGNPDNEGNWKYVEYAFDEVIKTLTYKLYILKKLLTEFENITKNYYVSDYYKAYYWRYLIKLSMIGLLKDDLTSFYTDIYHEYAKPKKTEVDLTT